MAKKGTFSSILPLLPSKKSIKLSEDKPRRRSSMQEVVAEAAIKKDTLEVIKQVLLSDPSTRTDLNILFSICILGMLAHLHLVFKWMQENCKNTNIFGSSHEYIGREICRQMRLFKLPSRAMLIRQGDTGDLCYILIDGLVDVYCKENANQAIQSMDEPRPDTPPYNVVKAPTDLGEYKATLGPGAVVGDMVLLNPSARRNATVVVSNLTPECFLIYLGRMDYVRLIRTVSMENSHYVQAEVLDFMHIFQKWPMADRMRFVSQMRSAQFRANEYLYRGGTVATMLYIIVSGEAMEKQHVNMVTSKLEEIKINVDLMLLGPGDIANEHAFLKSSLIGPFDIKAVTDVHVLGISRRLYDAVISSTKDFVVDLTTKLSLLAADRDDYRKERLEFGSRYPEAHVAMTWHLMRMSNLRCSRCDQRGHLANQISRCNHAKKLDWMPLQQRLDKHFGGQAGLGALANLPIQRKESGSSGNRSSGHRSRKYANLFSLQEISHL
ncbi:hypothetical protein LEN26_018539 [Aphanomyces euteiches]|nr:hypothetical protein LEN26_018539 [Aphanomyces euteiches]KAH9128163.1 hypothetical protein AeMF1_001639 [Aphanomyces euteiches]